MGMNDRTGKIQAHPSVGNQSVAVSYETKTGRKSFHLNLNADASREGPPQAIESFAMTPESYAELMQRVDVHLRSMQP